MEKMRSLDGKLKHQIDRMVKDADAGKTSSTAALRANPMALLAKKGKNKGKDEESEEEDEDGDGGEEMVDSEEDEGEGRGASQKGLYRAPKMAATPYKVSRDRIGSLR